MVSGRYFFPKAPLLCLKRMPALAVTSVNSMGPEGRAGFGFGIVSDRCDSDGVGAAVGVDSTACFGIAVSGALSGFCLQPANNASVASAATVQQSRIVSRNIFRSFFT